MDTISCQVQMLALFVIAKRQQLYQILWKIYHAKTIIQEDRNDNHKCMLVFKRKNIIISLSTKCRAKIIIIIMIIVYILLHSWDVVQLCMVQRNWWIDILNIKIEQQLLKNCVYLETMFLLMYFRSVVTVPFWCSKEKKKYFVIYFYKQIPQYELYFHV